MKSLSALQQRFHADPLVEGMDVYIVGGAVRDALLGCDSGDCDWVVVGQTPEAMIDRGFLPVGENFPVFLHPKTQEEYALARTERKVSQGYKGFTFYTGKDVTLTEDLARRDLTINAMAVSIHGELIDPFHGYQDLEQGIFRHVGPAFIEDPVRILRLARFSVRFPDFSIVPETVELCKEIVKRGEVKSLVPERVWKELSRALGYSYAERFFMVLKSIGADKDILGLNYPKQSLEFLSDAIKFYPDLSLRQRFVCVTAQLALADIKSLIRRLKPPKDCIDWVESFSKFETLAFAALVALSEDDECLLDLLEKIDVLRRPERLNDLLPLWALKWDKNAKQLNTSIQPYISAIRDIKMAEVIKGLAPSEIKTTVRRVRLEALRNVRFSNDLTKL